MRKQKSLHHLRNILQGNPFLCNGFTQGLVDVAKEITKLEGKKDKLNGQLTKLNEAMGIADYATKV